MNKYLIYILIIFLNCSIAHAEIIPLSSYGKVIEVAMNNFWGKVRLKDGSFVQAQTEGERNTLPITLDDAAKVIRSGEVASVAEWCGLDWKQNLFHVTDSARKRGLSGKQVGFVGLLHGVTMGTVYPALEGRNCSKEMKEKTAIQLREISSKLINFSAAVNE